jgi:hypothetical protein
MMLHNHRLRTYATLLAVPCVVAALNACDEPFPKPNPREYGTFGEEMYRLFHREFLWSGTAAEGTARAEAFARHRNEAVWAFDALPAGKVKDSMLPLLELWLPLYEPAAVATGASIPTLTRDAAAMIDALRSEPRLTEALGAASARPKAFPNALVHLLGTIARHETPIIDRALALVDALEPKLTDVFHWMSDELPTIADPAPLAPGERSLLARVLDVELESGATVTGPPAFATRIDERGAWRVSPDWRAVGAPGLVDDDGDGLPDIDARGRFVASDGTPSPLKPFAGPSNDGGLVRDPFGRAFANETFLFQYVDLRKSILAFALRDARKLLDRDAHFDLLTTFEAVIGIREDRDDTHGRFQGYRTSNSALLDVVHGLNELRTYPRIVELTRAVQHLVARQEMLLPNIVHDIARVRAIFDAAPSLTGGMKLSEDMHPVLHRLASHGGLRSLMAVAGRPETANLVPGLATMLGNTTLNLPTDLAVLQVPRDVDALTFRNTPDWSVPDTTDANRSWMQKAVLLIADTSRAPAFLRFLDLVDIPEVEITDDMARFYMEAIAGRAVLDLGDPFLENIAVMSASEFDDTNLSAEELNLFMNHDQPVLGNLRGLRGIELRQLYGPALLALQASRSLTALRPWVTRIVDSGHTADIVDLFVVLAKHWGETTYTVPGLVSEGTGLRRYEPFLLQTFEDTRLVDRVLELATWMDTADFTHDGSTLNVADEMDAFLRWLVDPDAGARTRTGLSAIPSARGGFIANPSRLQILLDGLDRMDQALDADPAARAAWDRVDLIGTFLDLDANGQLANQHFLDMLVALLPILADHVEQQVDRGEWLDDTRELIQDLVEFAGSRGFAAIVDIGVAVRDDPAHRALVDDLLAMMLAEEPTRPDADVFGALLRTAAAFVDDTSPVDLMAPLMRATGRVVAPEKRLVFNLTDTLRAMRAVDPEQVTNDLMSNLLAEPEVQRIPIVAMLDAFEAGLRPDPLGSDILDAGAWDTILTKLVDWFRDDDKGAERLYKVILSR